MSSSIRLAAGKDYIGVGVGAVVLNDLGEVLLILRRKEPEADKWTIPGGAVEWFEKCADAIKRECLEEVGVNVVVSDLVRRIVHRYPHGLVELHYFRCTIEGVGVSPREDSGFVWVAAGDLPGYRFPEANDALIAALVREGVGTKGSLRDEP